MNEKMTAEGAEAAAKLVRQRRVLAQEAIRARGDWSDDPGDRAAKGKECGGGLGVVMGIASPRAIGHGGEMLSAEERTECLADLHTLHAEEGVDVLEDFLLAVSSESNSSSLFGIHRGSRLLIKHGCFGVSADSSRKNDLSVWPISSSARSDTRPLRIQDEGLRNTDSQQRSNNS